MKKLFSLILAVAAAVTAFGFAQAQTTGNTADTIEVSTSFYDGALTHSHLHYSMQADFTWFNAPSSAYDHSIARLSLIMTTAAFKKNTAEMAEKDEYLRRFFTEAGFEGYTAYQYDVVPTADTVANAIAYRRMRDEEGDYVLLAVPVCGQGYGNEWVNNFTVGTSTEHIGFLQAAETVLERLNRYIAENLPHERIKLWACGFSRSAAITNVLGHLILSSGGFAPENVFVYTFGTPNTTREPIAYPQIHNICNGFDPIAQMPFTEWGYSKYGVTRYLPTPCTASNFKALADAAQTILRKISGREEIKITIPEKNWLVFEFLDLLCRYMPCAEIYTEGYQEAISRAWVYEGSVVEKIRVFLETARENDCYTEGLERIRQELETVIGVSLEHAVEVALEWEEETVWTDIFTSGKGVVQEHFPLSYMAWLFSAAEETLFQAPPYFCRLGFTDGVTLKVYRLEEAGETLVYDNEAESNEISAVVLKGHFYVDLPASEAYRAVLTADEEDEVQLFCGVKALNRVRFEAAQTDKTALPEDGYLEITVPAGLKETAGIQARLNGQEPVRLFASDSEKIGLVISARAEEG